MKTKIVDGCNKYKVSLDSTRLLTSGSVGVFAVGVGGGDGLKLGQSASVGWFWITNQLVKKEKR